MDALSMDFKHSILQEGGVGHNGPGGVRPQIETPKKIGDPCPRNVMITPNGVSRAYVWTHVQMATQDIPNKLLKMVSCNGGGGHQYGYRNYDARPPFVLGVAIPDRSQRAATLCTRRGYSGYVRVYVEPGL